MGAVASVFEAISRRCPDAAPSPWPTNIDHQRHLVINTRRALGLDWHYSVDCDLGNHSHLETTSDHVARLRDATIITVPNGSYATVADTMEGFITSNNASDFSIQGQALCPFCADGVSQTMCEWKFLHAVHTRDAA